MVDTVLLKDLAIEFGIDRSTMRRYVLKSGCEPLKVRTPESRGQLILALTAEDAEMVRELRHAQGYTTKERVGKPILDDGDGYFYIIQLVPDLDERRVKLGFTRDVETRLRSHMTAAPTAELLRTWRCHRSWEPAVIACLTRNDCEPLSDEAFVVRDTEILVERGDEFFALMPKQD